MVERLNANQVDLNKVYQELSGYYSELLSRTEFVFPVDLIDALVFVKNTVCKRRDWKLSDSDVLYLCSRWMRDHSKQLDNDYDEEIP